MAKLFEIGEELSVLIGDEVFEFRCNSTHTENWKQIILLQNAVISDLILIQECI
jgi:hypothetical protein